MEIQNSDVQNRVDCHRPLQNNGREKFNRLAAVKISGDEIFCLYRAEILFCNGKYGILGIIEIKVLELSKARK
jgi:hypothetical protein